MIDYVASFINTDGVAFPDTQAVNVSAPGAGDGTEFVALMVNDIWGRAQATLDYAGLTPDGVTEAPDTAQFLEAIGKGFGVGPGMGVIYWKNGTPAANGDRVLLLQGQTIEIASYPLLAAAVYVGDGNNATAPAFYKTSDTPGTIRDTGGAYMVLPDTRAVSLKGTGNQTINARVKSGPAFGAVEEDRFQGWQLGALADATGARNLFAYAGTRDNTQLGFASTANYAPLQMNTTYQGAANMLKGVSDGTNGTPRTGTTTRDNTLGTNYGITY